LLKVALSLKLIKTRSLGFSVDARGPAEFAPFWIWNSEVQRWRALNKSAGITAQ